MQAITRGQKKEVSPKRKDENRRQMHRLNLVINNSVCRDLEELSYELGTSRADLARHLLKFGIAALMVSLKPGGGVFIKEPEGEFEKIALQYL